MEAVRRRCAVFVNQLDATKYTAASEFGPRSLMAFPLVAFNEVIGATTFLHDSDEGFLTRIWLPRLPSWQVNWAVFSKPRG